MFAQSLSLSLRFAYRRHFHVIIMLSVSRFVCLRVFTFNVSVCICGGIHADVIETVFIVFRGCLYICCPSDCRLVLYILIHLL